MKDFANTPTTMDLSDFRYIIHHMSMEELRIARSEVIELYSRVYKAHEYQEKINKLLEEAEAAGVRLAYCPLGEDYSTILNSNTLKAVT